MSNKFNYAEKVQMAKKALTGPIASVSVPFLRDGQIDYDSLRSSVDFDVEHGSGTILLTYGDSLYSILTDKEITEISRIVVEQTAGRAMTCVAGRWWMGEWKSDQSREGGSDARGTRVCRGDDFVPLER